MLRISWPLALVAALAIAVIARRPRLLLPVLIVFTIWFIWAQGKRRR